MDAEQLIVATKQFSVILAAIIFAVAIYLLLLGRPYKEFTGIAVLGVVVGVLFFNIDRIIRFEAKIDSKGGAQILAEMQQIQKDIYAKADEVQRMGEAVAEQIAHSLSRLNRLSSSREDVDQELLKRRDMLVETLKELKSNKDRIAEIISPIELAVSRDLAIEVAANVGRQMNQRHMPNVQNKQEQIINKLMKSEPGKAEESVRAEIEKLEAWNEEIQAGIKRFEEFRKTKTVAPTPKAKREGGGLTTLR
ncbi:MAG: hypothetical protein HY645_14890 [Acidobacteria bacterium]|nr:hypothetical protein [Acidobacteriota bacterium]